jgi:transcription elongation factor Elf1
MSDISFRCKTCGSEEVAECIWHEFNHPDPGIGPVDDAVGEEMFWCHECGNSTEVEQVPVPRSPMIVRPPRRKQ